MATVVVIILGLFLVVETIKSFKQFSLLGNDTPAMYTITLSGEGEAFAKPDVAEFTFSIVEEAQTVQEASERVSEKENEAIDMLEKEGVEEKNIRTLSYNVYPRYEYRSQGSIMPGDSQRVLVGYEVRETIRVKSEDAQKAGELLSALGEIGVQNISGLTFVVEDEDEVRSEARGEAIENAREKAEELADQLGVKLVRVVSFNQGGGYSPSPYKAMAEMSLDSIEEAVSAPSIPMGENRFAETVSVTYEIR